MFRFIFSGKTSSKCLIFDKISKWFPKRLYNNVALKLEKQQEKKIMKSWKCIPKRHLWIVCTQNQEFWMKKCTEVLHEKEYKTKNLENYKGNQMPKK